MNSNIRFRFTGILFTIVLCILARPALAAWPTDPLVNVPVCTDTGDQKAPTITLDGAGGAIVTWGDQRSGNNDIYAQRISAGGTPEWTANGVVLCTATGDQFIPTITSDDVGGAIVTWEDQRSGNNDIYAQRVSAAGVPLWTADGVALCLATNDQWDPMIVSDGAGGAIVTWGDYRSGTNVEIYAQRISAGGTPQWTANGVALCAATGGQYTAAITSDGTHGAIVTWRDGRNGAVGIYAQRISAGGAVQWTANGMALCTGTLVQDRPAITSDGAGGAIVAWEASFHVYAQRISAGGTVSWTANGVAVSSDTLSQYNPTITSDSAGGAIVTWEASRSDTHYIYAQRISAGSTVQWTASGVALSAGSAGPWADSSFPTIVSDGAGGAIVTWADQRSGEFDIYAERISAGGAVQWTANGVALCAATGHQFIPTITSDGAHGAIVTWRDERNGNRDIYAQRVQPNGELGGDVTGTLVVRFEAVRIDSAIVVRWELADGTPFMRVTPERAPQQNGPWMTVVGDRHQQWNLTEVTDRAIEAGHTYWYRLLAVNADGAVTTFGPVRADGAVVKSFALGVPVPNPSAGPMRLEFSVAVEAPVRLSVVDVTGREVAVLSEGTLGAGHYLAVWDRKSTSGRIPAGLYFVRLASMGSVVIRTMVALK